MCAAACSIHRHDPLAVSYRFSVRVFLSAEPDREISGAISITEGVCDKKQDAMDNLPENLQCAERFEAMKNAVGNLNDAIEKMKEAKGRIEAAM